MNELRDLTERRAVLLKALSALNKHIDQLQQSKAKNEAFEQAMKYQG